MMYIKVVGDINGIAFSIPQFRKKYDAIAAAEGLTVDRKGGQGNPDADIPMPKRLSPEEVELRAYRELLRF